MFIVSTFFRIIKRAGLTNYTNYASYPNYTNYAPATFNRIKG